MVISRIIVGKKGISAVVATVLIILVAVAATAIIWKAIIPLVSTQLDKEDACLDATSQLSIIDKGFTCWQESGLPGSVQRDSNVQIKRGAREFDLTGIQIVTETNGISYAFLNSDNNVFGSVPQPNEAQVLRVSVLEGNPVFPLANMPRPDKVSIAPILTLGTAEVTCDVASVITIQECGA